MLRDFGLVRVAKGYRKIIDKRLSAVAYCSANQNHRSTFPEDGYTNTFSSGLVRGLFQQFCKSEDFWRQMKHSRKRDLVVLACLCSGVAYAQKTSGGVVGQATDATGAAVPNATVTLLNPSTGINRTTKTNGEGEYTFGDVPIGTYELDVDAASFKKESLKNVVVNVATTTRSDFHLSSGSASETVSVEANAIQVQTDSGALGNIIDGTQVKELPLNGRSFVQLTQLGPGVSGANNFDSKNKGLQGGVDFSVNGNPTTNNLFLVDGANDNDVGSNRTILIYPSIESIAEFKMLTNSYGAEYGQASGAIISIATRSGTNAFHGTAFYSGRNDALASYTYLSRHNVGLGLPLNGKDKLRRNDWGYSIGGPIKKDKLFFFFNEEWNHEIRGFSQNACVATAAEIAGDFTTTSCGAPQPTFPTALRKNGNAHILNSVDPAGVALADYYVLPNKPTDSQGYNWSQSLPTFLKWRQENVRVDYHLTPRNQIMGRYVQDSWSNPSYNGNQYWGDSIFPTVNSGWAQPSKQIIGRVTSTITNSLVNDAEFAYSNNRINITAGGTDPGVLAQLNAAIPTLYPTALKNNQAGSTPQIWNGLQQYGSQQTIQTIGPWNNALDIYTVRDDVSKVAGSHTVAVGLFLGFNSKDEDTSTSASEHPTFSTSDYQVDTTKGGVQTGNPLANVLVPANPFTLSETSTNIRAQLRWRDREFYAQDTYKITPKLTANYGLRYSMLPPTYQPNGLETNFQPNLYDPSLPASDACNGLLTVPGKDPCGDANKQFGTAFTSGTPGSNKYLVNVNNHMIAPRIGLAYDVRGNGKTAVRAGYGMFYQRERVSRYTLVANAPFAVTVSNYSRPLGGATPTSLGAGAASPDGGYDTANTVPMSMQWNATVEQSLARNTVLQVSYVGNRGEHLTSVYDVNGIQPQNWGAATFAPTGAINSFRPYSNFGTLAYWTHEGDSYFHGLETLFRTQIGQFRMQAAYTWSHAIADIVTDDSSGGIGTAAFTVPTNPGLDRGNTATNRPNIFTANGTYLLPRLQGHNSLTKQTLGGWEVTGITTAQSGNSLSSFGTSGENAALLPYDAVNCPVGTPTLTQCPRMASHVNSLFQSGFTNPERPLMTPGQTCSSSDGISGSQVLNPQAFTLVGYHLGTYDPATAPRGYCHGPKLVNTDLSLDKNWRIHERATIQFRFDAFDLFNHANFRGDQINTTAINNYNCGASVGLDPANGNALYAPCSQTNNVVSSQTRNGQFGIASGLVGNAERQFQYGLHVEF